MSATATVGAFVHGAPTCGRVLVAHAALLAAYAEGEMNEDHCEAYLSHFAFGPEMQAHYATNRNSVAGYAGSCSCRWLILDIDRPDLDTALADARKLVQWLHERYPELTDFVPVYFSGSKGFHVLVELAHAPPPVIGFQHVAKTLAVGIAASAGVKIDTTIYDVAHIIRLPNTIHPKTGLFKRLIDVQGLFMRDVAGHKADAQHPNPVAMPSAGRPVPQLEHDWAEAEQATQRQLERRTDARREFARDVAAPKFLMEFLRFGVGEGDRHQTLFRCAAWMTEQGAPPSLAYAMLTEPGRDNGLMPKDVERQIRCGIEHAAKQRGEGGPLA